MVSRANGHYVAAPEPFVIGNGLDIIQAGFDAQMKGLSARKVAVSLFLDAGADHALHKLALGQEE